MMELPEMEKCLNYKGTEGTEGVITIVEIHPSALLSPQSGKYVDHLPPLKRERKQPQLFFVSIFLIPF